VRAALTDEWVDAAVSVDDEAEWRSLRALADAV
jgi:hypothetical protein